MDFSPPSAAESRDRRGACETQFSSRCLVHQSCDNAERTCTEWRGGSNAQPGQLPVNGESLTRPAGVKRFLDLFCLFASFFFAIRHTPAGAQEHPFAGRIFCRRRSLLRVHPTRSVPCHFIFSVLPTKHLSDHGGP